ncbi:uncharacterized protein LOC103841107 [Brassica rapa]|uniref:uncharacterized protein LOC103841107 n=1 Tax=Brassica campestris TaxID=3711 RepID=UPI0004F1BB73|nr:uncharacterized protein LOC103841107 [Brassica rapa]
MASEKFCPHLPTIIQGKHIEALYELWGIDYAVEIEAPNDDETLETVRPGYCGAYMLHFEDGGLSFPLPCFLLEALAELGMAFAQMATNFFCYFLASWIRAREEGLEFGLEELEQLFAIKRNNGFPGTMILAPRPGHSIIDGIPNRDDRWREKFFVFKINPASVGDFDFWRIPREWSDKIEPFGHAPMTPELRWLIATLRRGAREKEVLPDCPDESSEVGSLERAQKARRGPTLRSRLQAQSPGLLARHVSIAVPVGGVRKATNASTGSVGDRALDADVDSSTHRHRHQRRALEEINYVSFNSPCSGLPPPLRASAEGTSQVDPSAHLPDVQDTTSWRFLYNNKVPILENPESLALIWRKIREKGCELPSMGDMPERYAYIRMAVANAKVIYPAIASDVLLWRRAMKYAAFMERQLADFPSKEEVGGHLLTIQQLRGEFEAVRVTEKQREVEFAVLKGKLAATEVEKVAV